MIKSPANFCYCDVDFDQKIKIFSEPLPADAGGIGGVSFQVLKYEFVRDSATGEVLSVCPEKG
jgi:hypothetical protein